MTCKATQQRYFIFKCFLSLLAICVAIFIFEVYLRYYGSNRFDIAENISHSIYRYQERPLLGEKNQKTQYSFIYENRLIYDEQIETDSWGRRLNPQLINSQQAYLFFGCSYTFGSALSQKQTLPYFFSHYTQQDAYNYARPGGGPHLFLRQVESLNLHEQLPNHHQDINAVYMFYDFQWRRVLGTIGWVAKSGANHPYFKWIKNEKKLSYLGSFGQAHPILSYFYFLIGKLHITHYIPEKSDLDNQEQVDFFCALFNEGSLLLKEKLGNRFKSLTVVAPVFEYTSSETKNFLLKTQSCLQDSARLKIIPISGAIREWVIDPLLEFHPRTDYNDLLGRELALYFKEK